jgi:hypothetical protein
LSPVCPNSADRVVAIERSTTADGTSSRSFRKESVRAQKSRPAADSRVIGCF